MWDCRRFVAGYVSRQYSSVPRVRSGMLYSSRSRGEGVSRRQGLLPSCSPLVDGRGRNHSGCHEDPYLHGRIIRLGCRYPPQYYRTRHERRQYFCSCCTRRWRWVSRTTTNHRPTAKSELEHRFRSDWSLCPKSTCVAYSCVSTWCDVGCPDAGRNRWAQEIGPRDELSGTASNYGHQSS